MSNKTNYIDRHIAERLRRRRREQGVSLDDLDKAMDSTPGTAFRFENVKQRIKISHLYCLSQAMDTDISYFFEGLPKPPPEKKLLSLKSSVYSRVVEFVKYYDRIVEGHLRKLIFDLVKDIAKSDMNMKAGKLTGRRKILLENAVTAVAATGLVCVGAFHPRKGDGVPGGANTLVLIGNAGPGMWKAFNAKRENDPNPLDAWTRRVLNKVAGDLGAKALLLPFEKPYLPFAQWAELAGAGRPSPIGILIHPMFGLWRAYRGALAFEEKLDLPPQAAWLNPCESCKDKPCLSACPVDALNATGFDKNICIDYLAAPDGGECLSSGCLSRLACPVGLEYRHSPSQTRFHMEAFMNNPV